MGIETLDTIKPSCQAGVEADEPCMLPAPITASSAVRGSAARIFQMPTAIGVCSWLLGSGEDKNSIEGV
jgi:hypothetical protein